MLLLSDRLKNKNSGNSVTLILQGKKQITRSARLLNLNHKNNKGILRDAKSNPTTIQDETYSTKEKGNTTIDVDTTIYGLTIVSYRDME